MNWLACELLLIAICTALVCVVPGVFLVLRGVSLMSDAMSHALLLGIVGMFLWVRSLHSPLLLVGAGIAGFAVVVLTEWSMARCKLPKDAAIGLFFPFFFSCAVMLITCYARDTHLDTDIVLLGDLVFAPFSRCVLGGIDYGPTALIVGLCMTLMTIVTFMLLRVRLITVLFDPVFASVTQARPAMVYYGMMLLTSMVAVSVFSLVGSVVVVALMIVPAASAWCTARSVDQMLVHAASYSIVAAVCGYACAAIGDYSIVGSIAIWTGILFLCVVIGAPRTGLIGKMWTHGHQWLAISSRYVKQHIRENSGICDAVTIRVTYGWSLWWTWCVLWYIHCKTK